MIEQNWRSKIYSRFEVWEVGDMAFDGMGPCYASDDLLGTRTVYHHDRELRSVIGDPRSAIDKDVYISYRSSGGELAFFCRLLHLGRSHATVMLLDSDLKPQRIPRRCIHSIKKVVCRVEPIDYPDDPEVALGLFAPHEAIDQHYRAGLVRRWRYSVGQIVDATKDFCDGGATLLKVLAACIEEAGHEVPAALLQAMEGGAA